MSNVVIQKTAFLRNILNLANDRKFKRGSPNIAKFLKETHNQINTKRYNIVNYSNFFSKIHLHLCRPSEIFLIYGVSKLYFKIKANPNLPTINFDSTAPSTQNDVVKDWDDFFKDLQQTKKLETAITSIKSKWNNLGEDFIDLVNKGDANDLVNATKEMVNLSKKIDQEKAAKKGAQPEQKTHPNATRSPITGRVRESSTARRPQSPKRPVTRSVIANSGEKLPRRSEFYE